MAKKSLPEHTLDMWVACAIAQEFRAPTAPELDAVKAGLRR
jgi:hypothetical protein